MTAEHVRVSGVSRTAEIAADPNRVIVFDTTMRDGEQAPGFSMSAQAKLRRSLWQAPYAKAKKKVAVIPSNPRVDITPQFKFPLDKMHQSVLHDTYMAALYAVS